MEELPFTRAEWGAVTDAALAVVNATLADDAVLCASHFITLQAVLAELRGRYGDHPVLLETEADFTDDAGGRVLLYERAAQAALIHGLPALSIRLSWAQVLLEELREPAAAREVLLACQNELAAAEDEADRKEWSRLSAECERFTIPPSEPTGISPSDDRDLP
jgi:hypothetical protein